MTDTSAENVEQMAAYIQGGDLMTDDQLDEAAATLRALVAERDAARRETQAVLQKWLKNAAALCAACAERAAERDEALAREAKLREALEGLMVVAANYHREWVVKNPDCAADPCAEAPR